MSTPACLVDTSVLVRLLALDDDRHVVAKSAVVKLVSSGVLPCFTPQVVRECWSVLTRPKDVNGYGLATDQAAKSIEAASYGLKFVPDTPEIYVRWLELVKAHAVSGRQVHDAYHVAAMIAHGITQVLTMDERDFKRYSGITIVHPKGA